MGMKVYENRELLEQIEKGGAHLTVLLAQGIMTIIYIKGHSIILADQWVKFYSKTLRNTDDASSTFTS